MSGLRPNLITRQECDACFLLLEFTLSNPAGNHTAYYDSIRPPIVISFRNNAVEWKDLEEALSSNQVDPKAFLSHLEALRKQNA